VSDDLTPKTAREVRMCREAVVRAIGAAWSQLNHQGSVWQGSASIAAELYPMPTAEVPRVVEIDGFEYRLSRGSIECRDHDERAWVPTGYPLSVIPALAALIANPTERKEVTE
jgi:hypothetical protein